MKKLTALTVAALMGLGSVAAFAEDAKPLPKPPVQEAGQKAEGKHEQHKQEQHKHEQHKRDAHKPMPHKKGEHKQVPHKKLPPPAPEHKN